MLKRYLYLQTKTLTSRRLVWMKDTVPRLSRWVSPWDGHIQSNVLSIFGREVNIVRWSHIQQECSQVQLNGHEYTSLHNRTRREYCRKLVSCRCTVTLQKAMLGRNTVPLKKFPCCGAFKGSRPPGHCLTPPRLRTTVLKDLSELRNNWQAVWNEVTTVASNLGIEIKLPSGGSQLYEGIYQLERERKAFKKHIIELL